MFEEVVVTKSTVDYRHLFRSDSPWMGFPFLVLLSIRGLAMWVYVPCTFLVWILLFPIRRYLAWRRNREFASLPLYVTVVDEWFIWLCSQSLLRPFTKRVPTPEWPLHGDTRPRTSLIDLM